MEQCQLEPPGYVSANGATPIVSALVVSANGDVYVGGRFTEPGGVAANNIAKWNGAAWARVAIGVNNTVYALAAATNGAVYVGGEFTLAGGVLTNSRSEVERPGLEPIGSGITSRSHRAGFRANGKLYASGTFTTTGDDGKATPYFAIYDPAAPLATTAAKATPAGQLYPNPAHGTATLRLPATAPRQPLTLTDALGRTVRRDPAPATSEAELDLRGLPVGTYVVRCGAVSQRLVVE